MHGLSPDTDVSFFVGQTLIQACFGPHDLILNFQGDTLATVSIWSSIGCVDGDGACKKSEDFREEADFLLKLLNVAIVSSQMSAGSVLCLGFENGTQLEIYDDSDQYESYSIHYAGKSTYV
ncbi:hypothetical protein [Acidicapsa acidisoli]|uniref:hypothetical protein n=1 Tax=Acidicapsa acidisoli TaxID=1615681 RepID=UPI0021E088A3|nr:hypothetical protein [Acidicapsa acidisoli]